MVGRRIARTEYAGSEPVQVERWAHAGDHVLLKLGPTGAVIERYLYGPQTDQLLAVTRAGAGPGNTPLVLWTLSDHQGTVRDVIDSTGVVRKHWAYDSFGNVTATSGDPTLTFDHLYTGREFDATTGLYFYRARWYDPAVGRFVSRDPLGLSAGDPNTSGYVFNSPTMNTDPSGLWILNVVGAAAGAYHAWVSGGEWWQIGLGTLGGAFSPLSAIGGLTGHYVGGLTATALGYNQKTGEQWGGLLGGLAGGLGDAVRRTMLTRLGNQSSPFTSPFGMWAGELGGSALGAGIGLAVTGTADGAFAGASIGMFAGGIFAGLRQVRRLRWTNMEYYSAKHGATRPNVPFELVDDLYRRTRTFGEYDLASRTIRVQSGLDPLAELGVIRHEYAHLMVDQYSRGMSNGATFLSNMALMLEEFGVHYWATGNAAKGLRNALQNFNVWRFGAELLLYDYLFGTHYSTKLITTVRSKLGI